MPMHRAQNSFRRTIELDPMTPSMFDVNRNIHKVDMKLKNAKKRLKKRRQIPQKSVNYNNIIFTEKSAISNIDRQML